MKSAGKLAYGFGFAVLLPLALAAWSIRLDELLTLPRVESPVIGVAIAVAALLIMFAAIVDLRRYGHGWPMSPYPPEKRVSRGVYGIIDHPIYAGAVLLSAGVAIAVGSTAGLWIATPVLAMACVAFVVGYEHEATVNRFGPPVSLPLIRIPAAEDVPADTADRLSIYLLVFLPWLLAFQTANAITMAQGGRDGWSRFDASIPILPWTEPIYFLDYLFVLSVPLIASTRRQLRDFAIEAWIAIVSLTVVYLAFPVMVRVREVPTGSAFTSLMMWERSLDAPAASWPAFHAVWAAIAATAYSRAVPRLKALWWFIAAAIAISCVTTGMHATLDVVAAAVAAAAILSSRRIGRLAIAICERLANSWREWDLGSVRLMNHGVYAALGSFAGMLLVAKLTGRPVAAAVVGLSIIAGAALWAQFIEGSPQLLRPFGYFGGVIGACIAIVVSRDPWLLLAAYAVAAPVIQACGRLRCLVQGCCHGRPTIRSLGMNYRHPRSRVTRLSDLAARPLHATQLYSIACNAVVFVLLLRLWTAAAPLQFIAGSYFVLTGLGRFVEEHFRGEPQTRIIAGLHSYQWLSIVSVLAGAVLMAAGNTPAPPLQPLDSTAIALAAALGIFTYIAYGVDFPRLNIRFARLV